MSEKLKTTQVKPYREKMYAEQSGRCAITHYPISLEKAVLDHDHSTGKVRGVLSRGANALLGKIENNFKRYGLTFPEVAALGKNLGTYLSRNYDHNPLHPTHKTDEEKRIRRNALAKKRRAAAKE